VCARREYVPLDVTSKASIDGLVATLKANYGGRVDLLIHNATTVFRTPPTPATSRTVCGVNYYGVRRLQAALEPLLAPAARVVVLASRVGDVTSLRSPSLKKSITPTDVTPEAVDDWVGAYQKALEAGTIDADGWPATGGLPPYRVSKMGVIALVRSWATAAAAAKRNVEYQSCCPGWVATDFGGASAPSSIEEGVDTPAWLALGGGAGRSGSFWASRKVLDFEVGGYW